VESQAIAKEIESLEGELSNLRARVEQDSSSFASLEQQVAELRESLLRTRESVSEHETRLADKQGELAEARRLEALANYQADLDSHREAAVEVARAGTDLLAVLERYDNETLSLRKLVDEMHEVFGDEDARVAEVEAAVAKEPDDLRAVWEAVIAAIGWRVRDAVDGEPADSEPEELPDDLQKLAQEHRRARIKEYFGKS
jgi:predicted  nucleic acid-binding Zn-ribbon protein